MEYRKICNVCGKIFCYTDKDLMENSINSSAATLSAIGAVASVFSGTRFDTYALGNQGNRYKDKVVDYNKCPSCNSTDIKSLSEADWDKLQSDNAAKNQEVPVKQEVKVDINSNASVDSLLLRTAMFLEEEKWDVATAYCEHILDMEPECALVYLYKLMIDLKVSKREDLKELDQTFENEKMYQMALRFADDDFKKELEGYNYTIIERKKENQYNALIKSFNAAKYESDYIALIPYFASLGEYKDDREKVRECEEKALDAKYNDAVARKNGSIIFSM